MKPTIGVFFGSQSPEHDVSIITGELVIAELKKLGYTVMPVYIGKTGEWYISDSVGSLKFFTASDVTAELTKNNFHKFYLDLEQSHGKLVFKRKGLAGREVVVNLAFPALHGSFGEDGTIQGLFEMFNVPYVGCDVATSAITMDKVMTKLLYQSFNIPTTKFVYFSKNDWVANRDQVIQKIEELNWPVFVKPARLGSSIGIAKVTQQKRAELADKIEVALFYDSKILVEEGVEPVMDITCCLLGGQEPQVSLLQESVFASDLFDFDEKYLKDGGAQLGQANRGVVIPARLPQSTTNAIRVAAVDIFKKFGCYGIARVDFLYNKTSGKCWANEVNPLPGTLYHHLWKASGVELKEVIQNLLTLAEERQAEKQKVTFTFPSNLLKQAGSIKLQGKKM